MYTQLNFKFIKRKNCHIVPEMASKVLILAVLSGFYHEKNL